MKRIAIEGGDPPSHDNFVSRILTESAETPARLVFGEAMRNAMASTIPVRGTPVAAPKKITLQPFSASILSPASRALVCFRFYPRLAPWATFWRTLRALLGRLIRF